MRISRTTLSDWFHRGHTTADHMSVYHAPVRLSAATQPARKVPGFNQWFAGSRQSTGRHLLRQAHQKSGSFPPPALPDINGRMTLSDLRQHRHPTATSRPLPSCQTDIPQLPGSPFPTCHAHYPDGPERVRLSVASPFHAGLPRYSGGSASMTSLSRPAQALLTLRPAGLLNRPKAAFVTRLRPVRLPDQAARQLPGSTDNSLRGSFLHW
jgi:hypothetical protein